MPGLRQANPRQDPHTGPITAMEGSDEAPFPPPLLQDQYWYCVASAHRVVVAKTRYLKRLNVHKAKLHRGITEAVNARELLKAEFQGRETLLMSEGDTSEAEF